MASVALVSLGTSVGRGMLAGKLTTKPSEAAPQSALENMPAPLRQGSVVFARSAGETSFAARIVTLEASLAAGLKRCLGEPYCSSPAA